MPTRSDCRPAPAPLAALLMAWLLAACASSPGSGSAADTAAPPPAAAAAPAPPAAPAPAPQAEPAAQANPKPAQPAPPPAPMTLREAQQRLAALGYRPGAADGKTGPRTREALKSFQQDQGLPPSGVLDAETMQRLRDAPPKR